MIQSNRRFDGRVADYGRFRERYDPDILLPRLRAWCGLLPSWLIADVGAGTGMLADVFLENGNQVLAVEPNDEMRTACMAAHAGSRLEVFAAFAEATSLCSQSIDLVCAGRAFHWFDADRSVTEFRRILKPDGWFLSVAFGRAEEGTAANIDVHAMLRSFGEAGIPDASAKYARLTDYLGRDRHHDEIEGTMRLSKQAFCGLLRSISTAPRPVEPRFPEFQQEIERLYLRHATGEYISLATRYWINVGRL